MGAVYPLLAGSHPVRATSRQPTCSRIPDTRIIENSSSIELKMPRTIPLKEASLVESLVQHPPVIFRQTPAHGQESTYLWRVQGSGISLSKFT